MENNEAKSFNGKDFVLGSIIGALGGALTALLLAPKTGTELRSDLNSGTVELKHRASDWKDKAYVKGSEWKETAVDKGSEWKDKAYVKGSEWKEKANDSTTRLVQKHKNYHLYRIQKLAETDRANLPQLMT